MKRKILASALTALLIFSAQPIASNADYQDVPKTHQYYTDIMYLYDRNIISDAKAYGINELVTREEVAVMIAKALGLNGKQRATSFSDIPSTHINSGYIQSAVEAGIIKGFPDNTFKLTNSVTRGQMAAFIGRAFKLPESNKTFKDMTPKTTGYEFVGKLAAANITTGYKDGTFKPTANLSRAHISVFIARAIRYKETGIAIPEATTTNPSTGPATQVIPGAPTSFKNCDAMQQYYPNGVAKGHPAYSTKQDRNNDGVACES